MGIFVDHVKRDAPQLSVEGTMTTYFQDDALLQWIIDDQVAFERELDTPVHSDTAVGRFIGPRLD